MTTLLAFALCLLGFNLLCISMSRNARLIGLTPLQPRQQPLNRWLGALLIAASLPVCCLHYGNVIGPVAWCGWMSLAVFCIGLLLSYRPALLKTLAGGSLWLKSPG
ncbi:DUF3325 domain-containing protein [Pokkaliibacter sp. MBI-7]|uniref:DUF3325 domain-containing protein n=1 Tax=Pokkaliibacter sp. MBI-7 TaxID=3040600 RepID=UPI00244CBF65|nr:DUF3325 domain-containing protein [Pokkaliibacter sp. MBI-7]MDH2432081.1 DUF3325 domain-containing protein [Pokkaliibacter sp. MBI-7]